MKRAKSALVTSVRSIQKSPTVVDRGGPSSACSGAAPISKRPPLIGAMPAVDGAGCAAIGAGHLLAVVVTGRVASWGPQAASARAPARRTPSRALVVPHDELIARL